MARPRRSEDECDRHHNRPGQPQGGLQEFQISLEALAAKCHAHPAKVGKAIKGLEELKLLEGRQEEERLMSTRSRSSARWHQRGRWPGDRAKKYWRNAASRPRSGDADRDRPRGEEAPAHRHQDRGGLAVHVLDLYDAVKKGAKSQPATNLKIRIGGPLEILRRYVDWLAEKDWEASSQVLKPNSPAFASFRRDFRSLEGSIRSMERSGSMGESQRRAKRTAISHVVDSQLSHNHTANLACSGQRFMHVVDSESRMFFGLKNTWKPLQRKRKSIEPNSHSAFIGCFIGLYSCAHADACLPYKTRNLAQEIFLEVLEAFEVGRSANPGIGV